MIPSFYYAHTDISHTIPRKITPRPKLARELHWPRDRRWSAKLVPSFADRGYRVVSATDPHGRIFTFLDRDPDGIIWEKCGVETFPARLWRVLWIWIFQFHRLRYGNVVVEYVCYKQEGRGFETRWGEWIFSIYLILSAVLDLKVYSTSNRNEYQKQKNVSGE
jgi:hypothetical protein